MEDKDKLRFGTLPPKKGANKNILLRESGISIFPAPEPFWAEDFSSSCSWWPPAAERMLWVSLLLLFFLLQTLQHIHSSAVAELSLQPPNLAGDGGEQLPWGIEITLSPNQPRVCRSSYSCRCYYRKGILDLPRCFSAIKACPARSDIPGFSAITQIYQPSLQGGVYQPEFEDVHVCSDSRGTCSACKASWRDCGGLRLQPRAPSLRCMTLSKPHFILRKIKVTVLLSCVLGLEIWG